MNTIVRHIAIDFSLKFIDDENFNLDLFEDTSSLKDLFRVTSSGFLVGKYNQIITTNIIFNN